MKHSRLSVSDSNYKIQKGKQNLREFANLLLIKLDTSDKLLM